MSNRRKALLAPLALILAGCAARPPSAALRYRFDGMVLHPPAQPKAVTIEFPAGRGKQCVVSSAALRMKWRGDTARIRFRPAAAGVREAARKLAEDFEGKGCVAPGEGAALASRVLEHLPAGLGALALPHMQEGHLDLVPPMRLRMLSPILPAGGETLTLESDSAQGSQVQLKSNLLGYETAWYRLAADPRGRGTAVSVERVEDSIDEKTSVRPAPRRDPLAGLPPGFLRLAVLTRFSQADHNIVAMAASSRERLDALTLRLAREPDAGAEGVTLAAIPREVALLAVLRVEANGRPVDVPAGEATVREALSAADRLSFGKLPKSLALWRPYEGRLIPVDFDPKDERILNLFLIGGEKLTW